MLRGLIHDTKAYSGLRQRRALIAGGVLEKAIYDDLPACLKSLRKGDGVVVAGLRGLGSSRKAIVAALDQIHDKGCAAVDISTGRRSDGRDGAKLLAEAIADLANERRGNGDMVILGRMGAKASAKARAAGRMPLELAQKIWFDKTLKNPEALARINGHPDYRKPYSLGTLYRKLGEREVMAGRPVGATGGGKVSREEKRERRRQEALGMVYFIRAADGRGPVKIGFSTGPLGRLASLQTSHHIELKILSAIPGTQPDEKALHERFARFRVQGEWFNVRGEFKKYLAALPPYKKLK